MYIKKKIVTMMFFSIQQLADFLLTNQIMV